MAICPADFKPCLDDLCYRGRCLANGKPMLTLCSGCGQFIAIDGPDADTCNCEPDDDLFDILGINEDDEPLVAPSDDLGIDEDDFPFLGDHARNRSPF
jgi:hypothetical protein